MAKPWPRRFRTYWVVTDGRGTAYLATAREKRSRSIAAYLADADKTRRGWRWWRRSGGCTCQQVDIKVRDAQ